MLSPPSRQRVKTMISFSRVSGVIKKYWKSSMITVLILMAAVGCWNYFPATIDLSWGWSLVALLPLIFILAAMILFGVHLLMRPKKAPADTDKKEEKKAEEKPEKPKEEKKKDDKKGPKKLGPGATFLLAIGVWAGVLVAIWLLNPNLWGWILANPKTFGGLNIIVLLLIGIGFLPISRTVRLVMIIGLIALVITNGNFRGPSLSAYHKATAKAADVVDLAQIDMAGKAKPTIVKAPKAPSWSELVNLPITDCQIRWSGEYKAEVVDETGQVVRVVDASKPSKGRGDNDFHDLPSLKCRARFQSLMPWGVQIEIP